MLRNLVLAAIVVAGLSSCATAAAVVTPLTLGPGDFPGVAVDGAGTAYVAWKGPRTTNALMFCRVARSAGACDGGARALPLPGPTTARPFVFVTGNRVLVLASAFQNTSGDTIFLTTSNDGGTTFGPAVSLGYLGSLQDAVAGPGDTISFVTYWSGNARFQNVPISATGPEPTYATLSTSGNEFDFPAVDLDGVAPFVLLHNPNGDAVWRRWKGTGSFNDAANWTTASTPGYLGEEPGLTGGPLGLFAIGRIKPPSLRPAVLKFAGSGFATPATIDATASGNPVVEQDAAKRLHAVYGSLKLRYAYSDNGTAWKVQDLVDSGSSGLPHLAAAPDHSGVVVYWSGSPSSVRLARFPGPVASSSAATSKTITVSGGKVTLAAPKACVPAHESFRVRVTSKRGGRFAKVTRVLFSFDGRKQSPADTRAPFSASILQLFIPGGTAHQIKARVTIRLRSGKSVTRTLAVHVSYC
jgi:hypothetical protein